MTNKKAEALFRNLCTRCDEPFMFAARIGSATYVGCRNNASTMSLITMFLAMLERVLDNMKDDPELFKAFKDVLLEAIESVTEEREQSA